MTTHGIGSIWLAEIGQRLREGEASIRLKDVEETTGARMESRIDADRLWANLWQQIEAEGLAKVGHYSAPGEEVSVNGVQLTKRGSDPAVWHL
jgi:hypothetical protein